MESYLSKHSEEVSLCTYVSYKDSFSLYFLGYVPDFNVVLTTVVLSCSRHVDIVEVPLLELYLWAAF